MCGLATHDAVRDGLAHRVAPRHFDRFRLVQQLLGEFLDLGREGGREEHGLTFPRQALHDAADVGHEAHVQHPVGLVEDEEFDLVELDGLLLEVIEQPPRSGHDDLHAAAQFLDLWLDVHAAIDRRGAQRQIFAVLTHGFIDLQHELARGGEHERAHGVAGGARRGVGVGRQELQQR